MSVQFPPIVPFLALIFSSEFTTPIRIQFASKVPSYLKAAVVVQKHHRRYISQLRALASTLRPQFAWSRRWNSPPVSSDWDFHVGRGFLLLALLREVRRDHRRRAR